VNARSFRIGQRDDPTVVHHRLQAGHLAVEGLGRVQRHTANIRDHPAHTRVAVLSMLTRQARLARPSRLTIVCWDRSYVPLAVQRDAFSMNLL